MSTVFESSQNGFRRPPADVPAEEEGAVGHAVTSAEETELAPEVTEGLSEAFLPDFELLCLANVESTPVNWLWPQRIARGKLTILAGDPGLGKSTVSIDIAATVSTGRAWPDAPDELNEPRSVVLLCAEDGLADTVRPRLETAEADLQKVYALTTVRGRYGLPSPFNLQMDVPRLEEAIRQAGDTALVVIDPVSCYLGTTDDNKNAAVRGVLAPLVEMAERLGVAVLLITHLNKNASGKSAYRLLGSVGIYAAARAVWMIQPDPSDVDRLLMVQSKNNIAPRQKGLAFRHVEGRIQWEAEPVDLTADDLTATENEPPVRVKEVERAAGFLREMLAGGPVAANELEERAEQVGLSNRTLKRAKKDLGVRSSKSRDSEDGRWYWRLPGPEPTSGPDPEGEILGTDGFLGPLADEKQQPDESEERRYRYVF
jgi:hypothetical protein